MNINMTSDQFKTKLRNVTELKKVTNEFFLLQIFVHPWVLSDVR